MEMHPDHVYQKSDKGWAELKSRSGALDALARAGLILINGKATLAEVEGKLGRDALPSMQALVALGFIERCPALTPPPAISQPVMAPAQDAEVHRASPVTGNKHPPIHPDTVAHWNTVRRTAMVRLAPHFGPDLMTILEPLMKADTEKGFHSALDSLETKIALYQGRKAAAKLFEGLHS